MEEERDAAALLLNGVPSPLLGGWGCDSTDGVRFIALLILLLPVFMEWFLVNALEFINRFMLGFVCMCL